MKASRGRGSPDGIDADAHRRLAERLQALLDSQGNVDSREIVGVVYSLFREMQAVQRRLNMIPEARGRSLSRWFWQPMRQEAVSPGGQPEAYVFCLADTEAHVRDGQSLIALARHLSFGDAPAVRFEPIPVLAERQQVPKALQGMFPTVAMLIGRPALFGRLMRQYFLADSVQQRFEFTRSDPEAPQQGIVDRHFGDVFEQRQFEDEGECVTEDYGIVRRFTFDDGPTQRTFYVLAGLSSLGTYAATLCSLFLLDKLERDLPDPPVDRSQLDILVRAAATFGEAFWNLDPSKVRVVRAYLDELVYQADAGVPWQAVPPRGIELVLRGPPEGGALDIDHIVLDRLAREVLPGQQQQARIIGCLIHRSMGPGAKGTTGADLADETWIWSDRDRGRKISPSEAISKMLNVARRHLGSALVSRENRYFVEVTGKIKVKQL